MREGDLEKLRAQMVAGVAQYLVLYGRLHGKKPEDALWQAFMQQRPRFTLMAEIQAECRAQLEGQTFIKAVPAVLPSGGGLEGDQVTRDDMARVLRDAQLNWRIQLVGDLDRSVILGISYDQMPEEAKEGWRQMADALFAYLVENIPTGPEAQNTAEEVQA